MHQETSKIPKTRAQTFLTSATTTIPSPALIHNSTDIQTVTGSTIINNKLMRQAGENEITLMTHDRLNERLAASTVSTIEEISISENVIPTLTVSGSVIPTL